MEHSNQKQINIGLGLAVLIFIITAGISYRSTAHLVETAETVAHTRQVLEEIEEVFSVVKDAETGQRGYIITGDEKFLEPYQAAISHLDPVIQSLRKLTADNPTQQGKVDTLEQLIEQRFRSLKEGLDLRTDQGFAPAMQWVLKGGGKGEMDAIRKVIAEMRQEENRLLKDREERAQAQTQKTLRILLVAALLGLTIFVPVFYLLNREIEERRRAEEAARRSGLFLDSIIENIPNMLFVKEAKELRFVRFNKAGEALLGYAKEDLIGKNDYDFFPKEQADFFIAKDRQVLNEGKLIDISEEPIQTRHRGTRILHTKKIPVCDEGGKPLYLLGISEDITERKAADDRTRQANAKLTELVEELEARKREMSLLSEMGELLQTCRTLQEADGVISQFFRQLFPAESGALYILMPSRNMVERNSVWGGSPPPVRVFPPDECWALRRGQIHRAEGKAGIICRHAAPSSSAATLCIPMQAQSDMLGVLHLILAQPPSSEGLHETEEGQLKAAKQKLAVTVTEQVALALSNIRLRETLRNQAIRDPLTGLFNRRYLEETLEQEISRAERNKQQIGVVMIDIDHFKRYNDTYGHEAGDAVLSELGRFLEKSLRGGDTPCRYGEEEFTMLLPGASLENALLKAERLREGVKELNVQHRGRSVGAITLSMGVACFPDQGLTGEILLRAADQALYQAKAAGRDRVMSAGAVSDVENGEKKKEGSPFA